jgi:hypothetical protein
LAPILAFVLGYGWVVSGVYAVLAAYIIAKHRSNISRLLAGTERRFSLRGTRPSQDSEAEAENISGG